ncbi:hypothetical protein MVEN_00073200 [Mycena venus]|uniref:CxC6 like cysteine cluster associated with KDZ domain-containing protein n=1 Tax=Mycena venus TaxID=2733690 RepID=A0A8H6Z4F6_9AGAR|nr:hypothetical protein MVEN_00073200 [Mycena venus]
MASMEEVYQFLSRVPGLKEAVGMDKAMAFVRFASRLKDEIILAQKSTYDPSQAPSELPEHVRSFLGGATDMPEDFVSGCWTAFSQTIWTYEKDGSSAGKDAKMFREFGLDHLLSARMLFPPAKTCTMPGCLNKKLLRDKDGLSKVVLFTLSDGACATYAGHLHCPDCRTTYHNNYSVHERVCTYYQGVPDAIQVGAHQYVEREVLSLFVGLMLISWTSATNAARVYDTCLSKPENRPDHPDWPPERSFKLRTKHVWDGFLILSLLEDCEERNAVLQVPNDGEQSACFKEAIRERNAHIRLCGQPEWSHYCDKCMRVWREGDDLKKIHVVVIDGITIGRPCCGVHNCPEPLRSNRHRFCLGHDDRHYICAVEGCEAAVEHDFLTCHNADHRLLETNHKKRDKALFQLRGRLQRANVSHPNDAFEAEVTAEEVEESTSPAKCEADKDPQGNRKLRALFGRRRTHNEQIFVRPCGIIVACATFYGSESVSQTVDMLQKVFHVDSSMPDIVIYDNNCTVYKYLVHNNIELYKTVGFPVDVFHWTCKHAKQGVECSYHCNPTQFPELLGEDGKAWFFNSSVAEQTNVWLGGYHSILREMGVDKYDFFLDEMIMRKNRLTKAKLQAEGTVPDYVPGLKM